MHIGDRIRDARRRLRMTQEALARKIGVEQSTISGWETDEARRPQRDLVEPLARGLKVTPHYLESGGADERGRAWDEDATDAAAGAPPGAIDAALLQTAIELCLRSLVKPYGIDIPARRIEQAAETAVDAYRGFERLQRRG